MGRLSDLRRHRRRQGGGRNPARPRLDVLIDDESFFDFGDEASAQSRQMGTEIDKTILTPIVKLK
jgi:acetyl-CoA carboxylase carboxyltransferase component